MRYTIHNEAGDVVNVAGSVAEAIDFLDSHLQAVEYEPYVLDWLTPEHTVASQAYREGGYAWTRTLIAFRDAGLNSIERALRDEDGTEGIIHGIGPYTIMAESSATCT